MVQAKGKTVERVAVPVYTAGLQWSDSVEERVGISHWPDVLLEMFFRNRSSTLSQLTWKKIPTKPPVEKKEEEELADCSSQTDYSSFSGWIMSSPKNEPVQSLVWKPPVDTKEEKDTIIAHDTEVWWWFPRKMNRVGLAGFKTSHWSF